MHGDEEELEAAGEEAEHEQHVAAVPERLGQRLPTACRGAPVAADAAPACRGAASANDSGRISSRMAAKISSVCCQPIASIRPTASGENRNCPNEPAAVPAPNAIDRHSGGISLPKAPITRVNEQPASPKPISTPADR